MSYRLLVLPRRQTMTPQLLAKIEELVEAGATVVGPRPVKSPSLAGYPAVRPAGEENRRPPMGRLRRKERLPNIAPARDGSLGQDARASAGRHASAGRLRLRHTGHDAAAHISTATAKTARIYSSWPIKAARPRSGPARSASPASARAMVARVGANRARGGLPGERRRYLNIHPFGGY